MVCTRRDALKPTRFAPPPWDERHPDWRRLERRLPPDHLARRIDRAVAFLDLKPLRAAYAGTGAPPYRPDLLLKAALYEVQLGHHSPAEWHRHAGENEPVRWLLRGAEPSRSRWYAFRDRLAPVLDDLNGQVLTLALEWQLTRADRAALDGSLVAANASRHRLLGEDALGQRLRLLEQACAADEGGSPPPPRPRWMARTPRGRQRQRRRLRRAAERLAERLAERGRLRACDRAKAQPVRLAGGDPEAVPGSDREKVYRPLYNVPYLVDLDAPLIRAYDVFAQTGDAGTLGPLLGRSRRLLGRAPGQVLTDSSYANGPDLKAAAAERVQLYAPWPEEGAAGGQAPAWLPKGAFTWLEQQQAYVCPRGQRLELQQVRTQQRGGGERVQVEVYRCDPGHCQGCPLQAWCTPAPQSGRTVSRSEHEGLFEALRARMATAEAQQLYRLRGQTVERSFADVKGHRQLRRFSGRGLARVRVEVGLCVLAHNALWVLRAGEAAGARARPQPPTG